MRKPIDGHNSDVHEDMSANDNSSPQKNIFPEFYRALKRGDEAAYSKLVSEQNQHLIDFLIGIIRSKEDAEEITQDIFIYVWQNRESIDFEKNIYGYMYTIAKNRSVDYFRQKKKREQFISEQYHAPVSHVDSPEDITLLRETESHIEKIISSMPESMKRIYNMRFIEGLSNNEIANRLATTPSNVRLQISNALKRIRNGLGL